MADACATIINCASNCASREEWLHSKPPASVPAPDGGRAEVAPPVVPWHDRPALDQRLSADRPRTASAIPENRSVKSAPRRLQTLTHPPCL